MGDYYALLGVTPGASGEEIRAAFRQLAKRLHPDVSRLPSAAERFRRAVEAYEVLSDPARRAAYDASYGRRARIPAPTPGGAYGPLGTYVASEEPRRSEAALGEAGPAAAPRPARGRGAPTPAGRRPVRPRGSGGPVAPVAPIGAVGSLSAGERARRAAEAIRAAAKRGRCSECGTLVSGEGDRCVACLQKYGTFQEHLERAAAARARRR